jgi:hypothetical protein
MGPSLHGGGGQHGSLEGPKQGLHGGQVPPVYGIKRDPVSKSNYTYRVHYKNGFGNSTLACSRASNACYVYR